MQRQHPVLIVSGTSHPKLAEEVAKQLKMSVGQVHIKPFPDNEIGIQIIENVRGRDVFALQTIARRPNHYLMEMLILIDALKRASAHSVTAVIPYFGYARQDRKDKGRVPITAKLVADLLQTAGATRVVTMDLHADQIQGFFNIPVDHLHARPLLLDEVRKLGLENLVVVAPDLGSIKTARSYAEALHIDMAIVDKRRVSAERVETEALIGNVSEKNVLIVDDMVSTGETLRIAARVCRKNGAKRIIAATTHYLPSEAFKESAIEKLLVTNSLPQETKGESMGVVSIGPLVARAIESILTFQSVSSLEHTPSR